MLIFFLTILRTRNENARNIILCADMCSDFLLGKFFAYLSTFSFKIRNFFTMNIPCCVKQGKVEVVPIHAMKAHGRKGDVEVYLLSFLPYGEVSDQLHTLVALPLGKELVPDNRRVGGLQNQSGHFGGKSLVPARNQNPGCPFHNLDTIDRSIKVPLLNPRVNVTNYTW